MELLLLGPYPPPHGGVQTNLAAIHRYLLDQGVCCHVINLTRRRQAGQRGIYYPNSALEVLGLLARLRYSIAHLHIGGDVTMRLLLLGLACRLRPGARTVLTLHSGGYPTSKAGGSARPGTLRGFVFRRFDRLIAVNEQLRDLFVNKFAVPPERVRVIAPYALPSAVPITSFAAGLESFFASHDPVLLSMGWLEPEYDYPLQIRALGLVREKYPRAGLLILGAGRLERVLREQMEATGYAGDVLLAGDVPHEIALACIPRSDLFLRTTHYDGDSISVRESLHFGTPVIATDNGMRPPGVTLVPMGNLVSLVDAIFRQLASGKPPRQQRAHADDSNIRAVFELYRELSLTET